MPVSRKVPRVLVCGAPLLLAALAACANPTYDNQPTDSDVGANGGSVSSAGSPVVGAGSPGIAGSDAFAGAPTTSGGDASGGSSSSAGSSSAGSPGSSGSTGFAGAPGAAGSAAGGAAQGGATGSAGSTSGSCTAAPYNASTVYMKGDKATKGGKEYTTAFYTTNVDPETHCCGMGAEWASSVTCN